MSWLLEAYCKSYVDVLGYIVRHLEAGNTKHISKLQSLNSSTGKNFVYISYISKMLHSSECEQGENILIKDKCPHFKEAMTVLGVPLGC